MLSRGTFWDRKENRRRHKFICPIRGSKKFATQYPYYSWFHPQFIKGSGCYKNIRVDVDETIRQNIDYGSESFKKDYNRRTSSERIFSRLLSQFSKSRQLRDSEPQPIFVPCSYYCFSGCLFRFFCQRTKKNSVCEKFFYKLLIS